MTIAFIALGANLGDPSAQLRDALRRIAALPDTQLLAHSSLYASAPVGYADQPDFVNAVCAVETEQPAADLLAALLAIELQQGRERHFKNAPRTLDLDVILYGDQIIDLPQLQVPHPRMHERAFVLLPLLEIAPDAQIPGRGAAAQFIADVIDQELFRLDQ
ncbi:2-amino-4-hydroxy-6-hydroxymethyldihydropteridine diphosphokinase [Chitinibacter bivalviorum]|uniref:2-amino-4-hydroxy-6-hydroxymethyldihydropteridine pyrophosphokinase n=1 Tax=Chitinibacter bivalviorum TaxID=2739434 RepID=A0A7H9BJP3_9NEIS|nr:2-amino-4-hydroxy-6-hydroxymethyldihydropteridine diphosphokinase [Chitinibacter bivalviorum]QLG88526.1 2-amino-4-hydroxy-6-hydroxymethyldihydropteridine diphosphokinase [Chitinibacter bivalviorum]